MFLEHGVEICSFSTGVVGVVGQVVQGDAVVLPNIAPDAGLKEHVVALAGLAQPPHAIAAQVSGHGQHRNQFFVFGLKQDSFAMGTTLLPELMSFMMISFPRDIVCDGIDALRPKRSGHMSGPSGQLVLHRPLAPQVCGKPTGIDACNVGLPHRVIAGCQRPLREVFIGHTLSVENGLLVFGSA